MDYLKWKDIEDSDTTFEKTVKLHKSYYKNDKVLLIQVDLESYITTAKEKILSGQNENF